MWDDFNGFRGGVPHEILEGILSLFSFQSLQNAKALKTLEWMKKNLPLTVRFLDLCFHQNPVLQYIRDWVWCGACHNYVPLDICTLYAFHSSLFPPAEKVLSVLGWEKKDILHLWYELVFAPYWDLGGGDCVCGRHTQMIQAWKDTRAKFPINDLIVEATSSAKTWRVDDYGYQILALNKKA